MVTMNGVYACMLSCFNHVWFFVPLWTMAHQGPLSMVFSRQEYWSGLPCHPPGDLPDWGIKPVSLMSPALADRFFTTSTTWEAHEWNITFKNCESLFYTPVSCITLYIDYTIKNFLSCFKWKVEKYWMSLTTEVKISTHKEPRISQKASEGPPHYTQGETNWLRRVSLILSWV